MSRLARTCILTCTLALGALSTPAAAQRQLGIIHRTPSDSATSGTEIGVMFDRPVAGSPDRPVDPRPIIRVEPAIPGTASWRDPVTLRFTPADPLPPGTTITVTIDTTFSAMDGARLPAPYRFTARIPGARILARSNGAARYERLVGVRPTLAILYSGPVELEALRAGSRVEFSTPCPVRTVALTPMVIRPMRARDVFTDDYDRDRAADRFRRVVELRPASDLPAGCSGLWHIPSLDPDKPGETWKYPLETAPPLILAPPRCGPEAYCEPGPPRVSLAAPSLGMWDRVGEREIARRVSYTALRLPRSASDPCDPCAPPGAIGDTTMLPAGTIYRVTVDTALRDRYGQGLTGANQRIDTVRHFRSRTWSPLGFVTVPRNARTLRVDYVNAETLTVIVAAIPERYRARVIGASSDERYPLFRDTLRLAMRDTFRIDVPVSAPRDVRTTADVPLPPEVGAPGSAALYSVRVWVKTAASVSPALFDDPRAQDPALPGRIPITANSTGWEGTDAATARIVPIASSGEYGPHLLGLVLQVSDLAVHAKMTADSGHALVTSLAEGGPVAGVALTLYDSERRALARGSTDTEGLARLARTAVRGETPTRRDYERRNVRYIEAIRGNDRVLMGVAGPLAPYIGGGYGGSDPLIHGALTTDRDIYRPGEMLYARLVVRRGLLGALTTPAGASIRWRLLDESGDEPDTLWQSTTPLSRFGTTSDSTRLLPTAKPGTYTLESELRVDGTWQDVATTYVRIAEYRTPELTVSLGVDSTTPVRAGVLTVPVRAHYLFGAPVVGMPVTWSARTRETRSSLPRALADSGYTAGSPPGYWEFSGQGSNPPMQGTATTSAAGDAEIAIPIPARVLTVDGALEISAAVTDANNQTVMESRYVRLPAPPFHLAARRVNTDWRATVGVREEFRLLAVRKDGSYIAGVPVRIRAVHQHCEVETDDHGRAQGAACQGDTVSRTIVTTGPAPVTFAFTPDSAGRYDILFEATDSLGGNVLTVHAPLHADTVPTRPPGRGATRAIALELHADTLAGLPGDTVLVRFDSPFALADAWITREREGVMEQRRQTVERGAVTLRVPITERDAPNVFVGVLLVPRARALQAGFGTADTVTRIGWAELRVDSSVKQLRVEVSARDTVHEPGGDAVLRVRVREATPAGGQRGVASEVALWAVDEGVLSLTGFTTPNVLAHLYSDGRLGARLQTIFTPRTWTLGWGQVLRLSSTVTTGAEENVPGVDIVAGGILMQSKRVVPELMTAAALRSNFRTTAFFLGSVTTDASGLAEVRATVPDNVTTYRLMATAVTAGDRYGSGEGTLLVTRALVARPALPRFVRQGDTLLAGALVNARNGAASRLAVTSSTRGIALQGDSSKVVTIAAGETGRARFAYALSPTTTDSFARVRFNVASPTDADAVEATLPIRSATIPRAHTIAGVLTGDARVTMPLPAGLDPARSRVTIHLGSSPLAAIRSNYERLREYPYVTSDAIASAGNSLLALAHAERALDVRGRMSEALVRRELTRAADELALRETDGWIVFWRLPDWHPHTNAWLTAYAGTFLLEAQRAGASVRPSLIAAIRRKLTEVALDSVVVLRPDTITGSPAEQLARTRAWLAARVVAAQFIRAAGEPSLDAEQQLLDLRSEMAWEDRLVLIDILSARGDDVEAQAMLEGAWAAVGTVGRRVDMPDSLRSVGSCISHIRPAARLLTTTMRLQPAHPLLGALVETVTQQGRAELRWAWNTQDYAAASTALATFAVAQRGARPRTLAVRSTTGRTLLTRTVGAEPADSSAALTGLITESGDSASLTLALSGSETSAMRPLYYSITVHEIPRVRPLTPDIKGLTVERWFESFETGQAITEAREGDLVRVRLRLTVPADRQFVVLEDLLPAGLEAVDLSLRTSGSLAPFATSAYSQSHEGSSTESSGPILQSLVYGSWDSGWWSPWEHKELRDDRVLWFARQLWTGAYTATYLARATTSGKFVLPPAHAEEMYDRAVQGRSGGGVMVIREGPR